MTGHTVQSPKGCDIGGAKELRVIYFPTIWGAKEPQNLPNHRVVIYHYICFSNNFKETLKYWNMRVGHGIFICTKYDTTMGHFFDTHTQNGVRLI